MTDHQMSTLIYAIREVGAQLFVAILIAGLMLVLAIVTT